MPLTDFSQTLERMQRALGRAYRENGSILNKEGSSIACKIDPNYYLGIHPLFVKRLAELAVLLPETVRETLIRTGNVVTKPPERSKPVHKIKVRVGFEVLDLSVVFIQAEFIDRALVLYGGRSSGLDISNLRIMPEHRPRLNDYFEGKTLLHGMAFAEEI